jgi:glycosyltransferase involved in cell wall biosynthesis
MGEPFVSVIVPTHNRAAWLRQTLASLEGQSFPIDCYEVIVVDNGSTDGTAALLDNLSTSYSLHHLYLPKEASFEASAARNAGIRASRGNILLFIDSDIVVGKRFIEHHVAFHRAAENMCVVGIVLYLPEQDLGEQAVRDGSFVKGLTVSTPDPLETPLFCFSENLAQYRVPWFVCHSGNFSVGKVQLEMAGLFDEWHKTWSIEDLELAYRLHRHGVRFAFSKRAVGYHLHHDTVPRPEKLESVHQGLAYMEERFPGDPGIELWGELWRYEAELLRYDNAMTTWQFDAWKGRRLCEGEGQSPPVPDLSLVIYAYNRREVLESLLHSLAGQSWPPDRFEVIVINGSISADSDDSEVMIQTIDVPYRLRYFATDWQDQANEIKVKRLGIKLALKREEAQEVRRLLERYDHLLERREAELKQELVELAQRTADADVIKFLDPRPQVRPDFVENVMASLPLDASFTALPTQSLPLQGRQL